MLLYGDIQHFRWWFFTKVIFSRETKLASARNKCPHALHSEREKRLVSSPSLSFCEPTVFSAVDTPIFLSCNVLASDSWALATCAKRFAKKVDLYLCLIYMFSAGREILSRFIPMTQAKTRNQAVTFTLSTIQDNVKSTLVQPFAIFNVRGTCM